MTVRLFTWVPRHTYVDEIELEGAVALYSAVLTDDAPSTAIGLGVTTGPDEETLIADLVQACREAMPVDPYGYGPYVIEAWCQHDRAAGIDRFLEISPEIPRESVESATKNSPTGWMLIISRKSLRVPR